ncbi:beta-trefoil DNA-binding domain-containing protein [Halteromyces radiatus]|uniref:beta-trefoil DNA-binding domain-containing protein n=1 Tax=Halteromyces radiatus TaxID=101107 RepID=UPI00221F6E11|nr:beta-trefoil DNA-binding domain-containing protein [Halteromyces radiatus]KAI8088806.1 beta-trefoil DNA-binding domain-containing protein [Halteromyces radiatus]
MPFLKQEASSDIVQQQQLLHPSSPSPIPYDAIRSLVKRYVTDRYGERTVMLLTSRVAQKSYGTEKRFLCPPPTTVLSGTWCTSIPSSSSTSLSSPSPITNAPMQQPRLTIQISGEATQQTGLLEWSTPPPSVLPSTFTSDESSSSPSTIGKCVSKHLHINDADEKRKRVQVMVNIQLPNGENIGTFASKGIKVISKPSKKRQSLKNIDLCIHHGTTISLFNRIRSQTVSTKYLGVSSQPNSSSSTSSSNTNAASNCCFVARTNVWDPFVIWIVDPQRTQQSTIPTSDNSTTTHYPPPPAMALHHTGKEQLAVHYNQPIVLQCLTTGLVSPVMTIRKVDKGSLALSGIMVMEPTLSSTSEALGDPVSQLHKVAFEIQPPVSNTNVPSSPSPSHSYSTGRGLQQQSQQQQPQQHRNTFLACLNDVVGRHKCHSPPHRLASTLSSPSSTTNKNGTPRESNMLPPPTTTTTGNGLGGRRRSSAASSSLDQNDTSQGAYFEQDVSDAAVWTIVGTDCVRYTFAIPPSDNGLVQSEVSPFPMVSSISQGDATLCLWGEGFTSTLTVYVGDQSLATEFKSPEALVCVIPSSLMGSPDLKTGPNKQQPILLVRKDGVIYKTNHHYTWKK